MPVELSAAESEEEQAHDRITMKTYYHYFIGGGGYIFTLIFILICLSTEVINTLSQSTSYVFIGSYCSNRLVDI